MDGEVQRDVLEKARGTPAAECRLYFVVDVLVKCRVGPIVVGYTAGPFVKPGPRFEETAPAVELVQADGEGDRHGSPAEEGRQLARVAQIIGRRHPALFSVS